MPPASLWKAKMAAGKCLSSYLEEELKLIGPKIIVPLGKWATKGLLSLFGIPRPEKNSMIPEMFGKALYAGNYIIFPPPSPRIFGIQVVIVGSGCKFV